MVNMATKKQLKQRCKELDEKLCEAWLERDALKAEMDSLRESFARKIVSESEYWRLHQEEKKRAQFYYNCMSKIRHILALDTIEQLTHRERNEKLRTLVGLIALWMNSSEYKHDENDDIPF